ncbi:protein unc-79 homolog [Gadus chalcogrammus]|uniref:protein unc-79 homolog n=1 Tax=Gadus chalcogrammus TaxID=1042646 RepID=UPI0024C34382|nr:protein unc-79 homolog [Gadus chalcogrammus]
MSTKAEQFASKIRYLQEYHNRVQHNIYPVPSGTDIANTLKYFSQTLLSILSRTGRKETQEASNLAVPMTMCLFPVPFPLTPSLRPQVSSINPTVTRSLLYSVLRDAPSGRGGQGQQSRDAQLSEYPSLDYQGLYVTLVTLLDLVPLLQHGQHDLGQSIFYTTTCLLPFLSDDILSTLPYTMISTLATFPPFLHKDIIEYLSTSFLPMAILGSTRREGGVPAYVNLSASSMLMIAMQYTSNPVYHCQLLECLMKHKQEVWKDLLYVISYGPSQVKPPAVQMLFHYWPNLKPPGAISEYRGLQYTAWNPIHCQHIECHNAINKPAVKMCIDPTLSVALGDKPPPLYICEECSQRIAGDHPDWLVDVLLPQAEISAICQKKNCSSHVRRAVVTCFSAGCCGRHGNRPVRYCKRCHVNHHSSEVGAAAETHLYQTSPPPINTRECGAEELVCTVEAVIRLASSNNFPGQAESMLIPGNAAGVAKQFLRCMFHQLAPNGILPQLFQSNIKDGSFLRTLASSLVDFNDLSSVAALNMLLEGLNNKKSLPAGGTMLHCLDNIATFMEALPMDSPSNLWTTICNQFQTFLAKLPSVLPLKCPVDSSLRIIICLLKIPTTNATRSLLEPFSKLVSFVIQYGVFSLSYLVELCGLCYRTFNKERDKFYMSRIVVMELLQALKFKSPLPDTNLLLLVQFVCADIGTRLAESTIIQKHMISSLPVCSTAAMECMRQYTSELLDFIADMHTLTKLKSHMKACCHPLHEDTFGGNLKVGLAQVAAMEISKGNHRDNKAVVRYLPWLYHPPSAMQQGPKEFIECVSHIRQLSWLLLGSLTHCALFQGSTACMPIPLDAGSHIADHLIVILIGFPEQSKTSVLHMCSLFHAFMFAQLWTIYCEQAAAAPALQNQNHNEFSSSAILTGLEFWSRVTPSILQLMAHNKVMVEMVCLHVISLMEALQECNSTIFVKLIPMWLPMIQSNLKHLSAGLQLRLQAIQNRVNHQSLQGQAPGALPLALRKWLQCTQFKMAQVEIQSSEAASQFYPM